MPFVFMNSLLIQSQTPYPLSIFPHNTSDTLSVHLLQGVFWTKPPQFGPWHSCPSGMPLQHHLAHTLSFVPMWDLLFPGFLMPSLSWLSHLFENVLQELLQKGCVGGKFLENLTFENVFILLSHLTDSLAEERGLPGRKRRLPCCQPGSSVAL